MGTISNHQPYDGYLASVFCAVGKIAPTPQTVTIGATAPEKGDTTVILSASASAPMDAGNFLLFRDTNGLEYLVEIATDYSTGTTLNVVALDADIPAGATAHFPPEIMDRTEVNLDRSYNTDSFTTLNTGGQSVVKPTTTDKTISVPGFYHHYNAGYHTAAKAAEAKKAVWLREEFPAPDARYSKGKVVQGLAVVTSRPENNPSDGYHTADLELSFTGNTVETPATPVA